MMHRICKINLVLILLILPCISANALKSGQHRQLTIDTARPLRFSTKAIGILALGAVDPDKLDWNTPCAHAQTPNDLQGHPTQTPEEAQAECLRYIQEKAMQIRQQLDAGNTANALYLLGYALHTIQDFSAHQGMTNAEHSFLSAEGHDPDTKQINIDRARRWTSDFLLATRQTLGADWEQLRNFSGPVPSGEQRRKILETTRERERGGLDLPRYKLSSRDFRKIKSPERSRRWLPIEQHYVAFQHSFTAALNLVNRPSYATNPVRTKSKENPEPNNEATKEGEARRRNEAIIRDETLGGSAKNSSASTSAARQPTAPNAPFDPSLLTPEAREAWERNQAIIARETLGRPARKPEPVSDDSNNELPTPSVPKKRVKEKFVTAEDPYGRPVKRTEIQHPETKPLHDELINNANQG